MLWSGEQSNIETCDIGVVTGTVQGIYRLGTGAVSTLAAQCVTAAAIAYTAASKPACTIIPTDLSGATIYVLKYHPRSLFDDCFS